MHLEAGPHLFVSTGKGDPTLPLFSLCSLPVGVRGPGSALVLGSGANCAPVWRRGGEGRGRAWKRDAEGEADRFRNSSPPVGRAVGAPRSNL